MSAADARVLLAVLLAASAAFAEPRWGLTLKSADGCLTPAELAEAIEKKLGRAMFGAKPDVRIDGWLRADGPKRWRARLTLVGDDGSVQGTREVTAEGASCHSIDDALTLVAAVMIDPAAALKGAPAAEPVPAPAEPLPEPSKSKGSVVPDPPRSDLPSVIMPKLPPRETWPGYLLVETDNFTQDGRWMSRGSFYRLVGRPDLDRSHSRRLTAKALSYVLGTTAMTAGALLMVLQPFSVSCFRYSENPVSKGTCLEASPWPIISGVVTLAVGVLAVVFGAVLSPSPTNEREDLDLAEKYNSKLKPPSLPVTASR